ncbi:hypothetical protein [Candidatus Epulonipiscium viviparus]|uniref:hypothetical protein n=1 Tax=Candidatus Epulonipiscium viviparus TaxID=420336 RepID=UPI00016C08B9|nr:hypothetical protein [Candidatus Epulopiscium viviparus]
MRMVPTNSLRPHCTLAIDVLDEHSQILLKQGHLLTDKTIAQLKRADLACVYIIDSYSKSLTPTYTALPHNIISRITALNDIGKSRKNLGSRCGVTPSFNRKRSRIRWQVGNFIYTETAQATDSAKLWH